MTKSLFVIFLLFGSAFCQQSWPAEKNLVGFWPLNSQTSLTDIVGARIPEITGDPRMVTEVAGPFGVNATAVSVTCDNECTIASYKHVPLPPSFTISFYYRTSQAFANGAIFRIEGNGLNLLHVSSVQYGPPTGRLVVGTEVNIHNMEIVKRNAWNFFAISHDSSSNDVNVYDANGEMYNGKVMTFSDKLKSVSDGTLVLGSSGRQAESSFYPRDALACFMIHNTTITPDEIKQLPQACEKASSMWW